MNLKESYRYANYLDKLLSAAYRCLQNKGFVTTTKQNHMRSKANSEAADEVIEVQKPYDADFSPNDVIDFAVKVLAEKERLADAVAEAKAGTEINIDNAVAMNKKKQAFVSVLNSLADMKASEKTTTGRAYKFNVAGDQVPYTYEVAETTSIDFNRNDVRNLVKKYLKETDEVSAKLDAIEINTIVNHVPLFDVNDNFEELVKAQPFTALPLDADAYNRIEIDFVMANRFRCR